MTYVNGSYRKVRKYTSEDIDWLIAVDVENNKFYLIDYTTNLYNGRNGIWLRLNDQKRKNAIDAKLYELDLLISKY